MLGTEWANARVGSLAVLGAARVSAVDIFKPAKIFMATAARFFLDPYGDAWVESVNIQITCLLVAARAGAGRDDF